jgi:hypothetical protein
MSHVDDDKRVGAHDGAMFGDKPTIVSRELDQTGP